MTVNSNIIKICYTPIEAAIRWITLSEHEEPILENLNPYRLLSTQELEERPLICLNLACLNIRCIDSPLDSTDYLVFMKAQNQVRIYCFHFHLISPQ